MSYYTDYLKEIEVRKNELGLAPKPIDGAELVSEIIEQIKDTANEHREDSLNFFIYNTLPGTTPAAVVKSAFLKDIVLGDEVVAEISPEFALEQLSHMKGGPSVAALLDVAQQQVKYLNHKYSYTTLTTTVCQLLTKLVTPLQKTFLKATRKQSSSRNLTISQKKST